jgi:hypothetical protein
MRRYSLAVALTFVVSLIVATGSAQAVVIDDQGSSFGVAMVPGTRANLAGVDVPTVTTSSPSCWDPAITADMFLPPTGLCFHGGAVLHKYETLALVWDPNPNRGWTAGYVEQFLRNVADGSASNPAHPNPSGDMSSPFALTPQYSGSNGPPLYDSLYAGGYDDATAYPPDSCSPSGTNPFFFTANGVVAAPNQRCLTDRSIKDELRTNIQQQHLSGHIERGYAPLIVVLTPPGVEVCLDAKSDVCSANGNPTYVPNSSGAPAQFCSYHSEVTGLDGQVYRYVVQPVTAKTGCDEPDAPAYPDPVTSDQLANLTGQRLVSPLSQAMIAAIVNPDMNGWFALDGSEINDNGSKIDDNAYQNTDLGCIPLKVLDQATVGSGTYYLQREFNNGGAIVQDPYALPCSARVTLQPGFVAPSPIDRGDLVELDGMRTPTTLLIPQANFQWDFGDGTGYVGASAVHAFAYGGTYTVTLKVTDRGGNTAVISQAVTVLGPGKPTTRPPPVKTTGPKLQARMQLRPEGLRSMLRSGVVIRVTSNLPANGVVTVSIPRADARRAHIKAGTGAAVVIGRGTVAGIKTGTVNLRVHLAAKTAKKLVHLRHLTVTIRISLVAKGVRPTAVVAAGRF